jgi:hypothetical protein
MIIYDELEIVGKEAVVAYFKAPCQYSVGTSEAKTRRTSDRIAGAPAEIRTKYLPLC